jgi:hypothetical protein
VLTSTKIMSSYLRASNLQLERKLEHLHSCWKIEKKTY